ncbi:protein slit [Culicoides brevitarsis]|uniref:protein slit n=1 Tax=Culicoides brevitarsis TaxID=469753 RepID=UPI00307CAB0F
MTQKLNFLINCIIIICLLYQIECKIVTNLCEKPINNPVTESQSFCECVTENSLRWGELVLVINCAEKSLKSEDFRANILPNFTVSLDLSYNQFKELPLLEGDELSFLDASYNEIEKLVENNFARISNLVHLDLSNNHLAEIDKNSFSALSKLTELNLANNMLHILPEQLFSPLQSLSFLTLSGNIGLNETFSQVGIDLFLKLGVTPTLNKLEIERCNLTRIDLGRGSWLSEVYLANNLITNLKEMPSRIRILDFSNNNIERLSELFFSEMINLEMILLQDMPELTTVEAKSFFPLLNLKHVSIRGSKKLTYIDAEAFGPVTGDSKLPSLDILNLQGTKLTSLNESLYALLKDTKAIDLNGVPLECDCHLRWIKKLAVETNGQCRSPKHLRGVLLSGVPEKNFECRLFPKWVYTSINGVLILVVLILCSLAVWFVTMKLKRTTDNRHKTNVHSSSPYAPITMATNVRESNSPYY